MSNKNPVVTNTQTNVPYLYLGENKFKNLHTGASGIVSDEMAQKLFKINMEATMIFAEYPLIEEMVQRLGLVLEK